MAKEMSVERVPFSGSGDQGSWGPHVAGVKCFRPLGPEAPHSVAGDLSLYLQFRQHSTLQAAVLYLACFVNTNIFQKNPLKTNHNLYAEAVSSMRQA